MKRFPKHALTAVAFTALLSIPLPRAQADERLEQPVQEIFLGEIVYVQEHKELQVTGGIDWHRSGRELRMGLPLTIEYGLFPSFQLGVELPLAFRRGEMGVDTGLGNAEAGVLFSPYESRRLGLGFSLGLGGAFPSTKEGLGEASYSLESVAIAYKRWGPLHLNLMGAYEIDLSEEEHAFRWALGAFADIGRVHPLVEAAGEGDERSSLTLLLGLLWHPLKNWNFGLGIPVDVLGEERGIGVRMNATWEMGFGEEEEEGEED